LTIDVMSLAHVGAWSTPHETDLGLHRISNVAGLAVSILPNGSLFALEHSKDDISTLISQVLGSPLDGGIGRILLRFGGASPANIEALGSRAEVRLGIARDRVLWEGVTGAIRHRVTLCLLPDRPAWLWRVEATNLSQVAMPLDAIFVQDLGLGLRAFVTNNEAYASQYIDHHVALHARYGPVVMSRQNLAQDGKHPWVVHGCLDGASAFATDAMQVFGPGYRDSDYIAHEFVSRLADHRLQHEGACAAIQSIPATL
jgi:cellobiose phosphorylase